MQYLMRTLAAVGLALAVTSAFAQDGSLKVEKFNHSAWTKGVFSEAVTVTNVGGAKFVYLAGIGAEEENGPRGNVRSPGNFMDQCRYAYDKIKRLLDLHGAKLSDAVKVTTYMTDLRFRVDMGKCIGETWGDVQFPTHTLIGVAGLAFPEMIIEIDVTAVVAK
jgi:2-iminobutanoate/2-iminopropanoate deaminase